MKGEFGDGRFPSSIVIYGTPNPDGMSGFGTTPAALADPRRCVSLATYPEQMHWIAQALLYFFVLGAVLLSLVAIFTAHGIG